jgi:hypothetical protein
MSHRAVRYASDYLVEAVTLPDGVIFHRIALTWDRRHPEAEGICYLDPNLCGLDEFGDPSICTLIAIMERDMKLAPYAEKPGYHAYTMLWRAPGSGAEYQEVPLRVVTIAQRGEDLRVRLLVLKDDGSIARVIALHEEQPT